MLGRTLEGADADVGAEGNLGIRLILVQVGMVQPPAFKGGGDLGNVCLAQV